MTDVTITQNSQYFHQEVALEVNYENKKGAKFMDCGVREKSKFKGLAY